MILNKKTTIATATSLAFFMMLGASPAHAIDMVGAFALAQQNDPKFQAAKSQQKATTSQALGDRVSYLPNYNFTRQQLPTLNSPNNTQALTQPLFNLGLAAQVAQGGPRSALAKSAFDAQAQELATRTVNAVNQIVLANETIKANQGQIAALESQAQGAKRKFELGQGTVTDMLDVQVKFEQAKANDLTLRANLKAAQDQFNAIVGVYPEKNDFILPNKHEKFAVNTLTNILDKVEKENPSILSAKANETIAKLDITKSAGAWAPTVGYTWQKTMYNSTTSINNGLTVSIPIDANSYVNTYTAIANSQKSSSERLATETQAKFEAQRLYALIEAAQESIKIKWQASDIARQSVIANQKSYEAGVKSTTDVLIAISTLYQARVDYVQSVTQQGINLLNLLLVSAEQPENAVTQTQAFLFRK
jgi:protease secretion system outer membrane protein